MQVRFTEPKVTCSICGGVVALEMAKTDDAGKAVHEKCYALRVAASAASIEPAPERV
jgi:hypothetical protein